MALRVKIKNRDSNYWLRDHVSHKKSRFDVNWTNDSALNMFSKIAFSTKFYEGLVLIYDVNCLF